MPGGSGKAKEDGESRGETLKAADRIKESTTTTTRTRTRRNY